MITLSTMKHHVQCFPELLYGNLSARGASTIVLVVLPGYSFELYENQGVVPQPMIAEGRWDRVETHQTACQWIGKAVTS